MEHSEPVLVILAAGMGSRFGGMKQMTPVDDEGCFIIDYSLYDAYRAGFRRVAFVIKHAIEAQFRETIGRRMERYFKVDYVFQELDRLPEGYRVPAERKNRGARRTPSPAAAACLTRRLPSSMPTISMAAAHLRRSTAS